MHRSGVHLAEGEWRIASRPADRARSAPRSRRSDRSPHPIASPAASRFRRCNQPRPSGFPQQLESPACAADVTAGASAPNCAGVADPAKDTMPAGPCRSASRLLRQAGLNLRAVIGAQRFGQGPAPDPLGRGLIPQNRSPAPGEPHRTTHLNRKERPGAAMRDQTVLCTQSAAHGGGAIILDPRAGQAQRIAQSPGNDIISHTRKANKSRPTAQVRRPRPAGTRLSSPVRIWSSAPSKSVETLAAPVSTQWVTPIDLTGHPAARSAAIHRQYGAISRLGHDNTIIIPFESIRKPAYSAKTLAH